MGRKLNISQPAVIQTELRPFNESFWIDANGQLEQWYYQNTGVFAPDRQITALCLTPMLSLLDLDTNTSYSSSASQQAEQPPLYVGFQSVEWKVKEWSGSAWVERTITSVSAGDNYYLNGNDLYVRKNNYDAAHAINITCRANYQDPRDVGTTCWLETTLMLSTNMDATQVYPTIDIKNPSARMFNPLKDNPIYEFEGTCDWSALEGQGGVNITECKVDPLGTEEILPTNEEQIINAAPLLNIHYGDIEKSDQQFMYRQTANGEVEEIAGGVAAIDNIKGNTAKMVQLVSYNAVWLPNDSSKVSDTDGVIKIMPNSTNIFSIYSFGVKNSHKYYIRTTVKGDSDDGKSWVRVDGAESSRDALTTSWKTNRYIVQANNTDSVIYQYFLTPNETFAVYIKRTYMCLDLTAMGIDNLTTVEQVETWLSTHVGNLDYIPYTEGKLVNFGGYGVKWNQLVSDKDEETTSLGTKTIKDARLILHGVSTSGSTIQLIKVFTIVSHKYLIGYHENKKNISIYLANDGAYVTQNFNTSQIVTATVANSAIEINGRCENVGDSINTDIAFPIFDLTEMFGAGNEPDLEWCNKYFSKDYYPYCPSVEKNILDVMTTKEVVDGVAQYKSPEMGVKTTGFNAWDEEYTLTGLTEDGTIYTGNGYLTSKNFIPVKGGTAYFFNYNGSKNASMKICQYDASYNHIGTNISKSSSESKQFSFTTEAGCRYIKFNFDDNYGTTYTNDICINISDPERNGTYEPYWESKSDMSWITKIGIENFNIWDEEWEVGQYVSIDGTQAISSKNFIPCIPNTYYYIKCKTAVYVSCFDEEKRDLGYVVFGFGDVFLTKPNAQYMKFCTYNIDYGSTYNHDICINISNPHFNGRYYPHGMTAPYFPNGLCKVGNVYDEVKVENGKIKGVVRFGCVDLKKLVWDKITDQQASPNAFATSDSIMNMVDSEYSNIVCGKYKEHNGLDIYNGNYDKAIGNTYTVSSDHKRIIINDTAYTTLESFLASLDGVNIIYQLSDAYEFEIDYPTKGQFEWYGVDGSGNEVPIDQLPIYSQTTQPSGYGQGTSRININALYGENIPVILRVKRYPWSSGLLPMKVTKSVAWKVPPIDVIVTSNKGGAVRAEHMVTPTNFTFSPIVNQQGEVISDDVKEANLVFKWYYVKYGVTGQAVTQLVGTGQTIDINTNTLINTTPQQEGAVKQSTNVYCEVYLLGAYHLVNGSYVRTID